MFARPRSSGAVFSPNDWSGLGPRVELATLPDSNGLLIRRGGIAVAHFDPTTHEVASVDPSMWDEDLPSHICSDVGWPLHVYVDGEWLYKNDVARPLVSHYFHRSVGGAIPPHIFELAACAQSLPDQKGRCVGQYEGGFGKIPRLRMAHIVADGEFLEGWVPVSLFLGSRLSTSPYQHFVQFISVSEKRKVGPTYKIPFVSDLAGQPARVGRDKLEGACFSWDSRFLVVFGTMSFVVIQVPGS